MITVLIEVDSSDTKIGAINDILDLVRYSDKSVVNFIVCGPVNFYLERELNILGVHVIQKESVKRSKSKIVQYLLSTFGWYSLLGRLLPDVVHFNYVTWGPSLGLAAYLRKIPMVGRAGGGYIKNNPSNKWLSTYLANCEEQAKGFLNSPLQDRVVVVGDLINFERLTFIAPPDPPLPIKTSIPRILFLGQLVERKGIDLLVRALAKIELDYEVLLVGGDWNEKGYPQEIKKLVTLNNLSSKIYFFDHRPDAIAIMKTCDIFALPSRSEAIPRSIIEAMLLGRCVVSTKVGGIPTLIKDLETGYLVDVENVPMLSRILEKVIRSKEVRDKIGSAARLDSEKTFNPCLTAKKYFFTYRRSMEL